MSEFLSLTKINSPHHIFQELPRHQWNPIKALAEHPLLLDVITRLLGEEPKMFQNMGLIKPPHLGREKPWHQDKAYFEYPVALPVVGVWIALDEATVANGCMHVQPQGHLRKKLHRKSALPPSS